MTQYTSETILAALGDASVHWRWEADALQAEFSFPDFKTAFVFMTQVAATAESLHHHPDWSNSYNNVIIRLRTHDQNAVTDLDVMLAKKISAFCIHP